jgi:hypothetical protein
MERVPGDMRPRENSVRLFAQAEALDELLVAFDVRAIEVGKQAAALPDELDKGALGVKIVAAGRHVAGKLLDTLGQDGYLHMRGAGVVLVDAVLLYKTYFELGV